MSGPTANGRINNTRTKSEIGWTRNEASFKPIPSTLQATGSAKKTCLPRALKSQPSVPFPQPSTNTIRSTRPPFSTSSSTPASIRSSVTASPPSRIAHPRTTAISLGTPPRVTIAFGTKSPSATKTVNTALARPLNPLVPSPRPAKTAKSRTSAVATISSPKLMDSTGQQRRDSLVNGRRLQTDVKQIQRPKDLKTVDTSAAEISKELGLLSGDVKVLKSVWEDSVANPTSFDEGSIDRNAIKSGYGSVFGFSLVSKPRNSIAVTEDSSLDRSQSISSIDSTFSSHSVASTKTISQLPVASSSETTTQTIPQRIPTYDSFLHDTSPRIAAPPSPTGRHLSSMHQTPHLPAQFSANSPDALDVYTAVQYLRSNSSTPELEFQLPASSSKDIVREDSASGPRSRASLRATSHVGYTRVAAGSSRTTSSAKDSPVTRARVPAPVDVRSEPSGYGTEGMESSHTTFTTTAPTSTFTSRNHIHPTELTNAATASRSTSLESSLQRSPGSSYGQRYTSPLSPSSSHISSPSPYLPVDQSSSPPTVNIKRLLSKPAPAGNSSASESESGPVVTRSPVVRRIERIEEKMEKQRIEAITKDRALESDVEGPVIPSSSFDGSRERDRARKTQWEAERRLLRQRSLSSHPTPAITTEAPIEKRSGLGGLLVRNTSLSRSREREGPEKPEKKSRNVLKRRPSATARATSPPPEPTNVMEFPYSSFAPAYTGSILPVASAPRPTTSSGNLKAPLTGSSSTRGPSPAPLEDKRRSLIPQSALLKHGLGLSDDNASVSSGTTPAKEVMLAYKQQQEREKMREKERSERAREKQRERELWQREEEERRQRVLKAEIVPAPSTLPTNSLSNGVSSAQVNGQQSSSTPSSKSSPVPNVNDNSPSTQSSNHIPSRTTKSSRESGLTDGEPSHPYYTILGNSKRVVAAEDTKIEDSYISDFSWSNSHSVEGISSSIGLGIGQPSGSPQSRSGQTWGRSASVSVGKPLSKSSSSFTIGKTLSRKVSGRLGTSVREPSLDVSGTPPTLIERGRPSLQERGLTMKDGTSSRPRGEKRNLRMSIDAYPSNSPLSPMKNSMLPRSPPIPDGGSVTPASKSSFSPSTHSSLPSPTGHSSGKNRIWNLMKRISTGGLRDSYHKYDSPLSSPLPPPPVPAIPKDLSLYAREMKRKEGGDMIIGQQKPDDISTVHPLLTRKRSSPSTPSRIPVTPSRIAALDTPTSTTRPGTTTRSSSPISSSDIGSSKFFNRSQSQRSSTSSYGEQIPPVPAPPGKAAQLQQHILPPSELYQLHVSLEQNSGNRTRSTTSSTSYSLLASSVNTSMSASQPNLKLKTQQTRNESALEDWMIVATPKDEKVSFSLPVPRRRNGEEGGPRRTASSVDLHPPSPTIPMFSNEAVINSWSSGSTQKARTSGSPVSPFSASKGTHSPSPSLPVIPSRSPKRSTSASSPSNEKLSIPTLPPLPPTTSATLLNVERHRSPVEHSKSDLESESSSKRAIRKSLGSEVSNTNANASSYIRKRATSGSGRPKTSPDPSSISARVSLSRSEPQHFRTHGALSDKEKADKWNDLLERSRRAGGTLHLNGMNKLASDGLGFSGNDSEDELQNDL